MKRGTGQNNSAWRLTMGETEKKEFIIPSLISSKSW